MLLIAAILTSTILLGAFLRLYRIGEDRLFTPFYSAAVRSMAERKGLPFFAYLNSQGDTMIEKPAMGFLLQALLCRLIKPKNYRYQLPQAFAHIMIILLLGYLVGTTLGWPIGLLAAFIYATMPVSVLNGRTNFLDPIISMIIMLQCFIFVQYLQNSNPALLYLIAILFGLNFNIKYFEAFLPLPVFLITLFANNQLTSSVILGPAIVTALTSSIWLVYYLLTPPSKRPAILDHANNNVWETLFFTLGISRFFKIGNDKVGERITEKNTYWHTKQGVLRLFRRRNAYHIGPMLLMATAGASLLCTQYYKAHSPFDLFWIAWFAISFLAVSFTLYAAPWYIDVLTPVASAMAGVGIYDIFFTRTVLTEQVIIYTFFSLGIFYYTYKALDYMVKDWWFQMYLDPQYKSLFHHALKILLVGLFISCLYFPTFFLVPPFLNILIALNGCIILITPVIISLFWLTFGSSNYLNGYLAPWKVVTTYLKKIYENERYAAGVTFWLPSSLATTFTGLPILTLVNDQQKERLVTVDQLSNMAGNGEIKYFIIVLEELLRKEYPELQEWIVCNSIEITREIGVPEKYQKDLRLYKYKT